MDDFGRVHALIIATRAEGAVLYERYYDRYSELDKAEIRAAFQQAAEATGAAAGAAGAGGGAADGRDACGAFRGACFVLIPASDLCFFALGSGEYDEMALSGLLRVLMVAIADAAGRPASSAVFLARGGASAARAALAVDEVLNEGLVDAVDRDAVRKGAKGKAPWE
jgi:hypothetical protein